MPWENTYCPGCSTLLIERSGYAILSNRVSEGRCPNCGRPIAGVGLDWLSQTRASSAQTGSA